MRATASVAFIVCLLWSALAVAACPAPGGTIENYVYGCPTAVPPYAGTLLIPAVPNATTAPNSSLLTIPANTLPNGSAYADPRDPAYGATCGSNFNANNTTQDDSTGLSNALASGLPVLIPYPGCKIANHVFFSGNGQSFFTMCGNTYVAVNTTQGCPYIFVTDQVSGTANNCAIDTQGYDGVALHHVTMVANYRGKGTVALCNSVGIRGGSTGYLELDGVSISNFGAAIGTALSSDSKCTPTGTLGNHTFQVRISNSYFGNNCVGMYGFFFDNYIVNSVWSGSPGGCISMVGVSGGNAGSGSHITNVRCEFSGGGGNVASGANYLNDGAGIYMSGGAWTMTNVDCDHVWGACVRLGDGAGHGNHAMLSGLRWNSADNFAGCNVTGFIDDGLGGGSYDATPGTTLTVTTPSSCGNVNVGMAITGASAGTQVTAYGSGTGAAGTYTVNNSQAVASGTLGVAPVSPCQIVLNDVSYVLIDADQENLPSFRTSYVLCTLSSVDYLTYRSSSDGTGTAGGGGTVGFANYASSIPHLSLAIPGTTAAWAPRAPFNYGAQSAAGTLTMDFYNGISGTATYGAGNVTVANPSNIASAVGLCGTLNLTQDSVGGRTAAFGSQWKFANSTVPTPSSAGSASDLYSYCVVSPTDIAVNLSVANYAP